MSRLRRFVLIAVSIISFRHFVPLYARADEQTQISLEQLQAMTAKWRAGFVNIRVVYEMRSLPVLDKPLLDWTPPADPNSSPQFSENEWIWADHGLDLFENRSFYWTPGQTGFRSIDIFNGPKNLSIRADYKAAPDEIDELKSLEIQPVANGKPISSFMRAPMQGIYSPATAEWLPEIIGSRPWTLEGLESILGDSCAKISNEGPWRTEILWLDLDHDGLPRRCQAIASTGSTTDFVVDELQQLAGGLWFPKTARVQLHAKGDTVQNQLVVVTEAEVNLSLDLSRFDPPEPAAGTSVMDGRTGNLSKRGETATAAESTPNTESRGIGRLSSEQPGFGRFVVMFAMICVSIASLAIGLWLRKK